jgi:flagellar biogenesis protein FliO
MSQQGTTVQPAIPFKRDNESGGARLASSGVGVLVVSLIAIAAVLVIRKRLRIGRPSGGGKALLQVLETQRMGPRALVSVVEFKGVHYLLAQSEQGVNCIASVPAGEQR